MRDLFFKNIFKIVLHYFTDDIPVSDLHRFMFHQVLALMDQVDLKGVESLPIRTQKDFNNIIQIGKNLNTLESDINWDLFASIIRDKRRAISSITQ